MIEIIKAEIQKSKRTSMHKFVIMTPLITLFLPFLWGGGQNGAYNWWYTLFLPGMLAIISSQTIAREKKLSYKGLFFYPRDKGLFWLGKIIHVGILLIISSLVFMVGIIGLGLISEPSIGVGANLLATIVLVIVFLFEIPMSLFLSAKFNTFVAILFNLFMTVFGVISFGTKLFSIVYPYAIVPALMVPILHILPNGLPISGDSQFLNVNIPRGLVVNSLVFLLLTVLTMLWFKNKEGN